MFFSKLKCEKVNGFSAWYLVRSTYVFGIMILFFITVSTAPSTQYSALSTQHCSSYRKGRKEKKAKDAKRNLLFLPSTQYYFIISTVR